MIWKSYISIIAMSKRRKGMEDSDGDSIDGLLPAHKCFCQTVGITIASAEAVHSNSTLKQEMLFMDDFTGDDKSTSQLLPSRVR